MEAAAPASLKYEEIEPQTETVEAKDCDTILLHVPGFRKEELKVQLTSVNSARIRGQREDENNKTISFRKDFSVSSDYDFNRVSAKFEDGILYVRLPKVTAPEGKQDSKLPIPEPPTPQTPADKPESWMPADNPQPSQKPADEADKGTNENANGSGKTRIENYMRTALDLAAKLKMSRRVKNVVLVGFFCVVLGLYFPNFIRSFWRKAED
ncbi:uncharacterized protein [Coffea arabica]|uniref:SHSP domain-containing protein n=1 Tax=Coffea arabica TaxID=13443 RepID=A0A6P6TTV9_COFAR